ncbi:MULTISPECIES: potassium-transporting ATPase subunit KdpC [unclassified Pseudomonas]|uniref:potassium-transporting ATPase subunit KdpC n=1 Tax=unclassified Pseudomonas TaxID=196821 RepID=UPI000BC41F39|nr:MULTISPECIES: potassium-transporting ATPase subunit KdpC [unclassified Pseudomonas]PVZ20517.1 K+-transporting ATPase ATPase C chain [Pseudomonas sp. URIL14HWK12:I12]PVZ27583.1 K+-transporting ATPase ATPase C chain [Pseudomonas sp. URIL14HWK12:I10]PVZ38472.1 K+-transporting ATPase ATPase C chain [Pseudomonas sp. URIL14HWK12:I11]SNZ03221.1 K+-transporting ATPase ATPase C chain [Pseudomonas sp. URIL14HWK12:I9]
MNTIIRPALTLLAALTLVTGVAYPLAVTAVAKVAFPAQAGGSLVRDASGQVQGSALIAQPFEGDRWFQPRPSAGAFATVASSASNLAPTNPALAKRIEADAARLSGQGQGPVPLALLTTSGSGLDPDLPPDAALWQVKRVAAARGLDPARVSDLVQSQVHAPLIGPPTVNVLALNRGLEQLQAAP